MTLISSRLTLIYKLILYIKGAFFFILGLILLIYNDSPWGLIVSLISILILIFTKSLKTIFVNDSIIVCKGFFSKSEYHKEDVQKVNYLVIVRIYYLKLKTGKKVFFLGTPKDYRNASFDSFGLGKKEIMDKIKN